MNATALVMLATAALVTGCGAARQGPTIRGIDLYAHVDELRDSGRTIVQSSAEPVTVRRGQYLVDNQLFQVFEVNQVIANCLGGDVLADDRCTLALLGSQRFTVQDAAPVAPPSVEQDGGDDLSARTKALIVTGVSTVALAIGAAKCDAFDGCGELLGVVAGLDGLIFLLIGTGARD